ncbi:polysaccharide pyruvyl transferase family protein [Thioclava sp. F28-4]|uniref:polysaccharide pyruvyl transferase family protein n=1 Tax=Thioclava sp. F28-4 TaxID=1915315 RepID=UPI000997E678|nr:polysaccharide pyruvyl transferase family protein [Thioclava sp. F28-4]OOY04245.1 hypothetical protein BMI87_11855 [Thioclava sp. F28-4]
MKILLRGYYGFGNFGDDLLLIATHAIVRGFYPTAEIYVLANNMDFCDQGMSGARYRDYIYRLLEGDVTIIDWRTRGSFDLEIHGGGGVFQPGRRSWKFTLQNIFAHIFRVRHIGKVALPVRKLLGKQERRVSKRSIGIGNSINFHNFFAENLVRNMEQLGRLDKIWVRDSTSLENGRRLGACCEIGTDLAFAHSASFSKLKVPATHRKGVGVILCGRKRSSLEMIEASLSHDWDCPPTFVFFEESYDADLIRTVSQAGYASIVWRPWSLTIDEFARELAKFSVVISNRFHGVISATLLGVPSITIADSEKLRSLQEMSPETKILLQHEGGPTIARQILDGKQLEGHGNEFYGGWEKNIRKNVLKLEAMIDECFKL